MNKTTNEIIRDKLVSCLQECWTLLEQEDGRFPRGLTAMIVPTEKMIYLRITDFDNVGGITEFKNDTPLKTKPVDILKHGNAHVSMDRPITVPIESSEMSEDDLRIIRETEQRINVPAEVVKNAEGFFRDVPDLTAE